MDTLTRLAQRILLCREDSRSPATRTDNLRARFGAINSDLYGAYDYAVSGFSFDYEGRPLGHNYSEFVKQLATTEMRIIESTVALGFDSVARLEPIVIIPAKNKKPAKVQFDWTSTIDRVLDIGGLVTAADLHWRGQVEDGLTSDERLEASLNVLTEAGCATLRLANEMGADLPKAIDERLVRLERMRR